MKEATIYYHIGKVQALHNLVMAIGNDMPVFASDNFKEAQDEILNLQYGCNRAMAAIKQEIENKIGE